MSLAYPELRISHEEEWQELQAVLQSEIFRKAPNLLHFLEYVAEQHFAGRADQIKEYSIAVQALHRPEQFDPQSDTIVRVTAHALRKKLEHYYATNGAGHSVQLQLPAGKYLLQFTRKHGKGETPYIDTAGQSWMTERYCQGGTLFAHPGHEIQGTDDPAIFQEGREGKFQCRIPASPGTYQLQLLFADTAGDKEAARQVDLTIDNRRADALDIVDEAGGDDIAIGKIYAGIRPMADGAIHLDFTSDGSFVNALEIARADSDGGQVLRMIAGPAVFRDDQGDTWLPERFFQGGRRTFHPDGLPKVANSRLFEWERYGHFHYLIPVVAGEEYKVRLFFSEGWFGGSNGGPGGIGSRVFDVYCNGTTLLKDFDILSAQKSGASVITFNRVKPTAHGMLDLEFVPVKNYPLINAIEIEPEK